MSLLKKALWLILLSVSLWAQELDPALPEAETLPLMPNLRGQTLTEARKQVTAPLKLVYLSSAGAANRVLFHQPGSGSPLSSNMEVTLYVSKAPPQLSVVIPPPARRPSATPLIGPAIAQIVLWLGWLVTLLALYQHQTQPGPSGSIEELRLEQP